MSLNSLLQQFLSEYSLPENYVPLELHREIMSISQTIMDEGQGNESTKSNLYTIYEGNLLIHLIAGERQKSKLDYISRKAYAKFFGIIQRFSAYQLRKCNCSSDEADGFANESISYMLLNIEKGKLKFITSSMQSYLMSIAGYRILDFAKKNNKLLTSINNYDIEDNHNNLWEVKDEAKTYMKFLSESCQKIFDLYYWKGYSMEEIAKILGYLNADSVKSQKAKCIKTIKDKLKN